MVGRRVEVWQHGEAFYSGAEGREGCKTDGGDDESGSGGLNGSHLLEDGSGGVAERERGKVMGICKPGTPRM